jgi:phage terminase large subunit-like protein
MTPRVTGDAVQEAPERYLRDPIAFITEVLVNPETGRPFELYPAQELWLREALTLMPDGTLPYSELVYSAPKKSGKTASAAMVVLYVVTVLGGPFAEAYAVANDFDQAQGRVYQAIARIVEASPLLRSGAKVGANRIEFLPTGSTITALAADYAGAAGTNPTITVFDELWAYTSERLHRLWDEMVPVPTRRVSVRLTVTYAGFEGESKLLEDLYRSGLKGEEVAPSLYRQPGLLMYWSHDPVAPWQTPAWIAQMRRQLRLNAFLRMVENRFVSGEEAFIPVEWWDRAATERRLSALVDKRLQVVLGVDAALKRDTAAVVACSWEHSDKRVRLVDHRIFTPTKGETLDLEATLEDTVRTFAGRFRVKEVRYDPWQFQRSAQTLARAGLPMVEFPQTIPNLTSMGSNLYELLKDGNLVAYADPDVRLAIQRAVAVETARGLKITKEKASHKIDVVVALAIAALGAVEALQEARWSPDAIAALSDLQASLRRRSRYDTLPSPGSLRQMGGW